MSSSNESVPPPAPAQDALANETPLKEGVNYWAKRWEEKRTGWHRNDVNPNLIKYIDWLTKAEDGKPKKIFVPLCGQTHDLLYLLQLGHEVFGIEAVYECILGLEERDGFKFIHDPEKSVYHTEDGKLKIYVGDFFECPIENFGPFDGIWDRGAFVAVEYPKRKDYIEVLKRGVQASNGQHDFRYLLDGVEYDRTVFGGPPRSINETDMIEYFSAWTKFELASKTPESPETGVRKAVPQDHDVFAVVYQLTRN